jgi:hypothetical protein
VSLDSLGFWIALGSTVGVLAIVAIVLLVWINTKDRL